jgi:hypothetical protein
MVKLLVSRNLIDRKFARTLLKQLLSFCARGGADVYHALDNPVRSALKALMDRHPQEVWAGVAQLLRSNVRVVRFTLEKLPGCGHRNHLGPGLLYPLPADLYLEWARRDAPHRASLVMDWLPIVTKAEDGTLAWHSDLQESISEFGNQDHVLEALSRRH